MESPERHRRLTELFSRARTLGPDERAAYLDRACAGRPVLRRDAESLLGFDEAADDFLSPVAGSRQVRALLDDPPDSLVRPSYPDAVGPYRILGLLGEGSQGIVFRAEQRTPRRSVALKVLRAGFFATRDDLRRFEREIRVLALLDHPAIATIHDGGETDDGHHYFAMELVEGTPFHTFVRDRALPLRERLELFCAACDGVQHAHREGVVHRDLKPTNILVDGDGNPKIVDFGLARLTESSTATRSAGSATEALVGSIRYMSPEQAGARRTGAPAQGDVYSLGVILYELLTDRRPYEIGSSLPDAVRTICETQPPPPSRFDRRLCGDLDAIVLTALEKSPARRYESVERLSEDIRRTLRGEPISVRRSNLAYVLRKRLARHRVLVLAAAAALIAAAAWVGVRSWSVQRQTALARARAVTLQQMLERLPAARVLGRAESLFLANRDLPEAGLVLAQAYHRSGQSYGTIYHLKRRIDKGRDEWAFRLLMAEVYRETDPDLAGRLEEQALEEFPDTAEAWYLRSFSTFDRRRAIRAAEEAVARDARHVLAQARLPELYARAGDLDLAVAAARRLQELEPADGRRFEWKRLEAVVLMKQGKHRQAIERFDVLVATQPSGRHDLLTLRAHAQLCAGDYERAVEDYTAAIATGGDRRAWSRRWRATPLWMLGRLEEAAHDYEVFRQTNGIVSYVDARLFLLRLERAELAEADGRPANAAALVDQAVSDLTTARQAADEESWVRAILDCLSGEMTPEQLIREANPSDPEQTCEAHYYAAEMSRQAGRIPQAVSWFRESVASNLAFDTEEWADPMSEYHLARWRLNALGDGPGRN